MGSFFSNMRKVEKTIRKVEKALDSKPSAKKRAVSQRTAQPEIRSFVIGITGEAQINEDGMRRQDIIRRCKVGELVKLIHEPHPKDSNAIKVCRPDGQQIGWIPQWASGEFAEIIKRGLRQDAEISEIKDGEYTGCRLKITRYDDLSWNEKVALRRNAADH